jgi:ribosomal protein S18 acetylase RimI-like enzyme
VQIKRATISDAEEILALQKQAFHSEAQLHDNFNIPPLVQTLDSIIEDFSKYEFYKSVLNNRIIGAVKVRLLKNNQLWIGRLVVHPVHQGKGIGRNLMLFIETKYAGAAGFELFTAQKSVRNIKFYEGLGYRIKNTYSEPGHDDIVLVKMIKN